MICKKYALRAASMAVLTLWLSGCEGFTPSDKVASYNPATQQLVMPAPCPDWSQTDSGNLMNTNHSNYGCAVNRNAALQLDDPRDLERGHGANRPDTQITTTVIEQYRAGKLPVPQTNVSTTGSSSQ